MREMQNHPDESVFLKLGKLISATLTKLKHLWQQENTHTGIQFYVEMED